jgi:hypothetical protein
MLIPCNELDWAVKSNSLSASQETESSLKCSRWALPVRRESFPHPRIMFLYDPAVGEQAANLNKNRNYT